MTRAIRQVLMQPTKKSLYWVWNYITIIVQWYRELRHGVNEDASAHSSKKNWVLEATINQSYRPEGKKKEKKTINQSSLK
jgi:hypothetical protein